MQRVNITPEKIQEMRRVSVHCSDNVREILNLLLDEIETLNTSLALATEALTISIEDLGWKEEQPKERLMQVMKHLEDPNAEIALLFMDRYQRWAFRWTIQKVKQLFPAQLFPEANKALDRVRFDPEALTQYIREERPGGG